MAAFTAPILAISPCISPPDGSTTECVVNEIPLDLGEEVVGGRRKETLLGLMVPLPLPSDCCDGTDEYNSGIVCENTCKYVGSTHPLGPFLALPGESGRLSFLLLSMEHSLCARWLVKALPPVFPLAGKQVQSFVCSTVREARV